MFPMPPPNPPLTPPTDDGDAVTLPGGVRVPWSVLRFQYARSSGPGGQNVNKVSTKAELWVAVTDVVGLTDRAAARLRAQAGQRLTKVDELHVVSDEHRSQQANKEQVVERLRELLLAAVHEPKRRRKTKPSRGAIRRRIESKKKRSATKALRRRAE